MFIISIVYSVPRPNDIPHYWTGNHWAGSLNLALRFHSREAAETYARERINSRWHVCELPGWAKAPFGHCRTVYRSPDGKIRR